MSDCDWYLSAYIAPPGPDAFICMRHNHCIALWRRTADTVELARYWEIERVSGLKHHATPLFGDSALRALLTDLLAQEGLALADVDTLWGTPGLSGFEPIPAGVRPANVSLHSLSHLWSSLCMDSELFKEATIVAMAMDAGPDFDLGIGSFDNFYCGAVSEQGKLTVLEPIASPAALFSAACQRFGLEPGSLMALASASDAAIDADAASLMDVAGKLTGPEQAPHASQLVQQVTEEASRQLAGLPGTGDDRFTTEENVASAVGKVVQDL